MPLDTPGTGSLTTSGSEETFAYPRRYDGAELKMVERLTADFYWVGATMLLGRYCLARYNGGDRQSSVFSVLPVVCKQSRLSSWVWKSWKDSHLWFEQAREPKNRSQCPDRAQVIPDALHHQRRRLVKLLSSYGASLAPKASFLTDVSVLREYRTRVVSFLTSAIHKRNIL